MKIGKKEFQVPEKTYVIGIMDVGDDCDEQDALNRAELIISQGAAILELGLSSDSLASSQDDPQMEINTMVPIVKKIKDKFDIPVSVRTCHSQTAQAVIEAGADMISDIWDLRRDPKMAEVIAKGNVCCCVMHNREQAVYKNFLEDVFSDLRETIKCAESAGISDDKIILNPGIGYGKTNENNLAIVNVMEDFHMFGYPILLDVSNKKIIENIMQSKGSECLACALAIEVIATMKGCSFIRTQNALEVANVVKVVKAVKNVDKK